MRKRIEETIQRLVIGRAKNGHFTDIINRQGANQIHNWWIREVTNELRIINQELAKQGE